MCATPSQSGFESRRELSGLAPQALNLSPLQGSREGASLFLGLTPQAMNLSRLRRWPRITMSTSRVSPLARGNPSPLPVMGLRSGGIPIAWAARPGDRRRKPPSREAAARFRVTTTLMRWPCEAAKWRYGHRLGHDPQEPGTNESRQAAKQRHACACHRHPHEVTEASREAAAYS